MLNETLAQELARIKKDLADAEATVFQGNNADLPLADLERRVSRLEKFLSARNSSDLDQEIKVYKEIAEGDRA